MILVALFWTPAGTLRGVLSSIRKTLVIAMSAGLRLIVMAGIGFFAFIYPDVNGAVLGILAFAGAFLAETILLGWYLWDFNRRHENLFAARAVPV